MASKIPYGVESTSRHYNVKPENVIVSEGWNPRIDFGDVDELAESIRENGVLMPITVRRRADKGLELVDGERRLRACLKLRAEDVDVMLPAFFLKSSASDSEALVHALISNHGKPLTPLEEARAFARLREAGMTLDAISKSIGHKRSHAYVHQRLKLLEADPELQESVERGEVPASMAQNIVTASKGDKERERELTREAKTGKEGRRRVRTELQETSAENGRSRRGARQSEKSEMHLPLTPAAMQRELDKIVTDLNALATDAGLVDEQAIRAHEQADDSAYIAYLHGYARGLLTALGRKDESL